MPKTKDKTFVFNDEKVRNSYGFIIPTAGISLGRFKKNPVMLDSHWKSNSSVLGKWENIKQEKGLLTGEPLFDSADENVSVIEGKVNRGFIKSCSMGISFHRENLKYVAGQLILEKCELYEVSIVAVPSNANSIRLYAADTGDLLKEEEIQDLCLSVSEVDTSQIQPKKTNNLNNDMKITLTSVAAIALGFSATELEHDSAELSAKIVQLEAGKKAAELQLSTMKSAQEAEKLTAIKSEVQLAFKAGKIAADKVEEFENLGVANRSLLTSTLAAIPAKASLAKQVENNGGPTEVKTPEDFQKLGLEAQLTFKAEQPQAYKNLFTTKN
ncbi:HK97 family phage prohead protease [Tenacibaculum maritimum]|nr:HK97 family phage prohead protease [Tenacibaculum maritimum]MDB0610444.1 HK97 family phage prohead protease [Tenacibaculum maritimum]